MTDLQIGVASFPILLLLIFLRVPVGLAMLSVGLGGMVLLRGTVSVGLAQLNHLAKYLQFKFVPLTPAFLAGIPLP